MKINIVRPIHPPLRKIRYSLENIFRNGIVTNNGKNVQKFEKNLQKYLNSKYPPVVFCNGQMAFFNLLQAWRFKLKLKNYDKVYAIVPSFTWSGTINSLVMNNIEPIFCDIDDTLTIDLKKVQKNFFKLKKIKKKIKFIVPVSNYGNIPDVKNLKIFLKGKKIIPLIDSAPALGSTLNKKFINNLGIDEMFSFHATKILSSMEGGCVVSNHKDIINYLKYLRDFGQFEKSIGDIKLPGLNSKMQEVSAIVGNENLKNFKNILKNRVAIINKYKKFFSKFEKKGLLSTMKINSNVFCVHLYFPILLNKNIGLFKNYLKKNNINFRKYYSAVHTLNYYKNQKLKKNIGLEYTNSIKDKVIALPIFSNMKQNELNYFFKKIENFFK